MEKEEIPFVSVLYAFGSCLAFFLVLLPPSLPPNQQPTKRFNSRNFMFIFSYQEIAYQIFGLGPMSPKILVVECWKRREAPHSVESQYTVVVFHLHSLEIGSPERKSLCIICDFFFVLWHHHQFQALSINTLPTYRDATDFFQHMLIHFK